MSLLFRTILLRDIRWFPQIKTHVKLNLATVGRYHEKNNFWGLIMTGWWITRNIMIHHLYPIKGYPSVIFCVKVNTSCGILSMLSWYLSCLSSLDSNFCRNLSFSNVVLCDAFGIFLWIFLLLQFSKISFIFSHKGCLLEETDGRKCWI